MEFKQNTVNIAFICDQNYVICTGVAIFSLIKNKSDYSQYRIFILANQIDKSDCELFLSMRKSDVDISIIEMSDYEKYRNMVISGFHVSPSALYKFDLPGVFPEIDNLLYLDGDIIVQGDLSELYNQDITDCYAAVVKDKKAENLHGNYRKRLKIQHNAYFNSGVMLLNLEKMRQNKISLKLLEYRKTGINAYMDQDAFNVVFEEAVKYLPLKYNLIFTCLTDAALVEVCSHYDMPVFTLSELIQNATILHFASHWKPWKYDDVLCSELWMGYFGSSPFSRKNLKRTSVAVTGNMKMHNRSFMLDNKTKEDEGQHKISVIIPVYNAEKYLAKCLNSLRVQTFPHFEAICVDDGSTDRSIDILMEFQKADNRFKIIRQQNQFAGVARNNGIKMARCKYITFLDSDDSFAINALELFYKKACDTNADIVLSKAYIYDEQTNSNGIAGWCLQEEFLPSKDVFSLEDIPGHIYNISSGNPWGKLFLRQLIVEYNLEFLDIERSEDFYFVYTAFAVAKRITTIRIPLVYYRTNTGTSLEDLRDKTPVLFWVADMRLKEKLKEIGVLEFTKQSYINASIHRLVNNASSMKTVAGLEAIYNKIKEIYDVELELLRHHMDYFWYSEDYSFLVQIVTSDSFPDFLFKQNRPQRIYSKDNSYAIEEIKAIRSSISFRIGRAITYIPRKIRGVLRCNREHGIRYTVQRINERLNGEFKNRFHKENVRDYDYYKNISASRYRRELMLWYEDKTGHTFNLRNPRSYNEKIQWLKLYDNSPLKTRLADKFLVREWVKGKIGEEYLIPLLGVWESFDQVDFAKLPDKFVLKANHGSGWNIRVTDKRSFNVSDARNKFHKWMNTDFAFVAGFELHYKGIRPRIIAEQYLGNGDLPDYKVMCFNGRPHYIWVDSERYSDHKRDVFDLEWNLQPFTIHHPNSETAPERPQNLSLMIKLAEILCEGFAHVRVDFYEMDGKLYFGEMTFTSESGIGKFSSEEYDLLLGNLIRLPKRAKYHA